MIYINGRFLSQPTTGVQRYATEMSRQLRQLSQEITVLTPKNVLHDKIAHELSAQKIGFGRGYFWEQVELPLYLLKEKSPLLINFGNIAPIGYRNSIVVIYDVSYLRYPERYSKAFSLAYKLVQPIIARRARKVVTVSEFSRKEIEELLRIDSSCIHVIPGAASDIFKPAMSGEKDVSREQYCLAVSSLDPAKNFVRLVKAFQYPRLSDIKLIIVGAKVDIFTDERFDLNLSLSKRIEFVGRVDDTELCRLYQKAELFVFPSYYEGFGLPPLEAMMCGCPTVVANAASIPEVCGDASLYIDPLNVEDIASGIVRLLGDLDLRAKLKAKGLERARMFNWNKSATQLLELISKLG
ncbi:MAG: glycosyltransferase family 1 protein [candidate division Zixibacteria bacterium]|nr:glycosyltransferase family 1 protein [candidate division Zixibacteria bacterium]